MEKATGEPIASLEEEIRKYRYKNLQHFRLARGDKFKDVKINIQTLDQSEAQLILDRNIYELNYNNAYTEDSINNAKLRAQSHKNSPLSRYLITSYMIIEGKYDEAEKSVDKALDLNPEDIDLLHLKADILMTRANESQDPDSQNAYLSKARRIYGKITKSDPNNGKTFVRYLESLRNSPEFLSDNSENVAWLTLELIPHSTEVRKIFSVILSQRGKFDDALFALEPYASVAHETIFSLAAVDAVAILKSKKPLSLGDWVRLSAKASETLKDKQKSESDT